MLQKMTLKDLREFIFENYYKQISFTKKRQLLLAEKSKKTYLVLFAINLT